MMIRSSWIILIITEVIRVRSASDHDVRDNVFIQDLKPFSDLQFTGNNYVHIAMIITNAKKKDEILERISRNLDIMVQSIFKYSFGRPLHFIIITDEATKDLVKQIFKNNVGKFLTNQVLLLSYSFKRPKLKIEFVSLESMTDKYRESIDKMKLLFGYHDKDLNKAELRGEGDKKVLHYPNSKYTHDLFFIAPFYHKEVMVDRLIVLDIDLEFKTDVLDLYKMFMQFNEEEMIGLGVDMSPHYYGMMKQYRQLHPDTILGTPGRFQGFNSGVALYNLKKMRASEDYAGETEVDNMKKLQRKYLMAGTVGDQDWLTLLGWDRPEMFHVLPCHYNVQTHEGYKTSDMADRWQQYRNCSASDPVTKIIHNNGSW